jgi:hypothetical protein
VDIIFVGSCGIEKFHGNWNINRDNLGVKRENKAEKSLNLLILFTYSLYVINP